MSAKAPNTPPARPALSATAAFAEVVADAEEDALLALAWPADALADEAAELRMLLAAAEEEPELEAEEAPEVAEEPGVAALPVAEATTGVAAAK